MAKDQVVITAGIGQMIARITESARQRFSNPLVVHLQDPEDKSDHPTIIISQKVRESVLIFFTRTSYQSVLAVLTEANRAKEIECGLYDERVLDLLQREAVVAAAELNLSFTMRDYTHGDYAFVAKKIA